MRLPVACSIIAHVALLLIALRLPAAGRLRAKSIEVEINEPKQTVVPKAPPPPAPEPPKPKPLVQKPEPLKNAQRQEKHDEPPPSEPPKQEPPKQEPPPSSLSMRPSAPVDLTLHGLGGIVVNNGAVHGGEGGPAGMLATNTPRKPWKPRGDAGDPLLGKLPEEKEERFPLKLESDGYHYDGPSFSAKIAMDGHVSFDDHSIRDFKGLSGGFDITDLAMKGHHQDPYRYEKEKFMDTTSKLRAELTAKARKERLESSLAALPAHLEQVWSDGSHSARERRGVLYAMWREAAGSDDEVGAAGRKARATIEAFIRERLPAGSENAFTDDELRRYNARTGAVKFEPYRAE
ncbi:MAG TPA: hypothetical protein VF334_04635 [Polyangia bacterium]